MLHGVEAIENELHLRIAPLSDGAKDLEAYQRNIFKESRPRK